MLQALVIFVPSICALGKDFIAGQNETADYKQAIMINIKTLENVPFEDIHSSWLAAFSDYQVKINMPIDLLRSFFRQNSVDLSASFGAFDGDKLVGLWMNGLRPEPVEGLRNIGGIKTAYDSGTAIWPEYRSMGISKMLASSSNEKLKSLGVKEYRLEVISTNERAYDIYLKEGFKITRNLGCYSRRPKGPRDIQADDKIKFEMLDYSDALAEKFPKMEYTPSWQNETTSMLNIKELVKAVVATDNNNIVGFGLVQPGRGRISQLGFAEKYWNTELPHTLLSKLCSIAEDKEILVINVDLDAKKTVELFLSCDFEPSTMQFEMKKDLIGTHIP